MNRKTLQKLKHDKSNAAKRAEERLDLWRRMQKGDTKALMKLSFMRGMITAEEYEDFQRIEKEPWD